MGHWRVTRLRCLMMHSAVVRAALLIAPGQARWHMTITGGRRRSLTRWEPLRIIIPRLYRRFSAPLHHLPARARRSPIWMRHTICDSEKSGTKILGARRSQSLTTSTTCSGRSRNGHSRLVRRPRRLTTLVTTSSASLRAGFSRIFRTQS